MYPLAACSVLLIAAIIYRMFNMKRSTICPARLTRAVEQYTRGALERSELERMAADSGSVEGRLVLDALNLAPWPSPLQPGWLRSMMLRCATMMVGEQARWLKKNHHAR